MGFSTGAARPYHSLQVDKKKMVVAVVKETLRENGCYVEKLSLYLLNMVL